VIPLERQRIAFYNLHRGKAFPERGDQVPILLDSDHPPCPRQQRLGETAGTRTDLQHGIVWTSLECIGNSRQDSGIRKKMLTQSPLGVRHD
jgi:hypothetical protein